MALIGTYSMPKIPIDFQLGAYFDDDPKLASRATINCYPETLAGSVNRTVLRQIEGYRRVSDGPDEPFNHGMIIGNSLYYIAGRNLYSQSLSGGSPTLRLVMNAQFEYTSAIMETNGKTIIMLLPGHLASADYYWDISSSSGGRIVDRDGNYSSYGEAYDVAFKDGYYFFITLSATFHGSNSNTTDGLTFDPLSFAALPSRADYGRAVSVANSQLYVMTQSKTYIYQTAKTTPYSFSRSVGMDIELGVMSGSSRLSFDDKVFIVGSMTGSPASVYIINGTSFTRVSNDYIDSMLADNSSLAMISLFNVRGHQLIQITYRGENSLTFVYDYTQSNLVGAPVWHQRAIAGEVADGRDHPIKLYLEAPKGDSFKKSVFAIGHRDNSAYPALYKMQAENSMASSELFGWSPNDQIYSEYGFGFIRNDGDPINPKKIRIRFTDGVDTAELFMTNNGVDFSSVGIISLSNIESKTAEWRRIGRVNEDTQFKLRMTPKYNDPNFPTSGNKPMSAIEGYIII